MAEFIQKFINASRGRGFEGGDGKGGTASIGGGRSGLTENAQAEQTSASDRLKKQRNAFRTVFAGETGNVTPKSNKLGITGSV